ncbi:hypothetical protein ABPG74_005760 [Tetrahymena malaccensis]
MLVDPFEENPQKTNYWQEESLATLRPMLVQGLYNRMKDQVCSFSKNKRLNCRVQGKQKDAEIYFAYFIVQNFVEKPYLPCQDMLIFQIFSTLINKFGNKQLIIVKILKIIKANQSQNQITGLAHLSLLFFRSKAARFLHSGVKKSNQEHSQLDPNHIAIRSIYCQFVTNSIIKIQLSEKAADVLLACINFKFALKALKIFLLLNLNWILKSRIRGLLNQSFLLQIHLKKEQMTETHFSITNYQYLFEFDKNKDESSPFLDRLSEGFEIQQTTQEYIPFTLDENESMLTDIPLKNLQELGTIHILDEYELKISNTQQYPF